MRRSHIPSLEEKRRDNRHPQQRESRLRPENRRRGNQQEGNPIPESGHRHRYARLYGRWGEDRPHRRER